MLECLAPYFQGDLYDYGAPVKTQAQAPADALSLRQLLTEPAALQRLLDRHAASYGQQDIDPRAIASSWAAGYLWALLPACLVAACLAGRKLPVHAEGILLSVGADGRVQQIYLPDEGEPFGSESRYARYQDLLQQHLAPLIQALQQCSGVSRRTVWGTVARYSAYILEELAAYDSPQHPVLADKAMLLDSPYWPDAAANPMYAKTRIVTDSDGQPLTLHRQCCLWHKLPGEGYCQACPLSHA